MNAPEAAGLALKIHGAVWLAAAAAFYKYGDRTELFDKTLRGNQATREAIRDRIAEDMGNQIRPVLRDSTARRVRSPILNPSGTNYEEDAGEITRGEPFRQAIRDFVSADSGSLLDYRSILTNADAWRLWAHRLSRWILVLVISQTVILLLDVLTLIFVDPARIAPPWAIPASLAPTAIIVLPLFFSLCMVHVKHGVIVDIRERYDT